MLAPKDTASLIGQVRLAVDAEHHVPLRVEVYAANAAAPAFKVAFEQVDFSAPDAEQFTFNPPPGTKVNESSAEAPAEAGKARPGTDESPTSKAPEAAGDEPTAVGTGWTTVVVAKAPLGEVDGPAKQFIDGLPKVSGTWGSGRLLTSALFSALLTDDGRVLAGAVAPEKLYEAAAK